MNKFKTIIASCLIALSVGSISTAIVQSVKPAYQTNADSASYWSSWITTNADDIATGGNTLMSKLKTKISSATKISYSGLWSAYATSDVVPGYENDSNSNKKIWDMYAGLQYAFQSSGSGIDTGTVGGGYNREHSIPNSWWGATEDNRYTDLVCLIPTDGKVNGVRSNHPFGIISGTATNSYAMPEQKNKANTEIIQIKGTSSNNEYSRLGTGKSLAGTSPGTVFEPADQYKGDFARIYMYFACRYAGAATSTSDGQKMFKTSYPYVTDYTKELLKQWHISDPVSTKEINRNNAVEQLQGNRNPFVDYPQWADSIFDTTYQESVIDGGGSDPVAVTGISLDKTSASVNVGSNTTITATISPSDATDKTVKWSSSNTSVATVSSATSQSGASIAINGVSAGSATITATSNEDSSIKKTCTVTVNAVTPAVTSVTLNKSTLSLAAGKSETLTATVVTVGGAAQTVNWESSNTNVATVTSGGVVTVKSNATVGQTATITATSTVDSNQKDSCLLTVKDSSSTSTYTIGWGTATGTAGTYSNFTATSGSVANIVSFASDKNSAGSAPAYNASSSELRLYYHSSGDGGSITLTPASGITITKVVIKTSTSPSVKYTVDGGSATSISASNNTYTISGISASSSLFIQNANTSNTQLRIKTIEITYEESSTPTPTKTLSSISISGYETSFTVGDTFSFGGTVTANYSDGSDADVTASASFSGYDMSSAGNQTVTVSYTEGGVTKDKTYDITVSAAPTPTTDGAYKLVSDVSKLRVGDKVIIVNTAGTYALSTTQNGNNRASTSVSKNSDGTISIGNSVQSLELKAGTTSGTFSFYTGSGYLYAASSSKNYLRTETSLSANSSFTIAIAENIATVTAQGTNTNKIMRYNANNGNPIFSCYSSANNTISIYKKLYTAVEYSKVFLDEVGCDASGATAPSQDNWSLLKYRYTNELSSDAKTTLSGATAHEYKNPSTDEQYLAQAMYQYDYIMGKYNKTSVVYEKFITGRTSNGLIFNGNIYASNMNDNIVPILVIIGILSLTGAGIILFVRKRKEI